MEVIKNQMRELSKFDECDFSFNGQDALARAVTLINESINLHINSTPTNDEKKKLQPVKFMLLDFQMPRLNGLQVVEQLKEFIKIKNAQLMNTEIVEPEYVFLTAFLTQGFRTHV